MRVRIIIKMDPLFRLKLMSHFFCSLNFILLSFSSSSLFPLSLSLSLLSSRFFFSCLSFLVSFETILSHPCHLSHKFHQVFFSSPLFSFFSLPSFLSLSFSPFFLSLSLSLWCTLFHSHLPPLN